MWLDQLGLLALSFIVHKLAHAVFIKTRRTLQPSADCFYMFMFEFHVWSYCDDFQVIEDLREECSKYGQVMKVVVPRPPIPQQAHALFNQQNYGKVSPVVIFLVCLPTVSVFDRTMFYVWYDCIASLHDLA